MFKSSYLQTDVTCVQIFKHYLVAGVGGFLHIYDLPKINLIERRSIFEGQKIYGIKPNSQTTKLIVYGGKHIALIPFEGKAFDKLLILSDWILDAKWIDNDTKFVTAFMHNTVTVWSDDFASKISVKCEERCILYSAHICYDHYNQLLVLSGTVFSEVLLWKPYYTETNGLSPVLKRLKEHKGVIFSIDFNLDHGFICTASDDRSAILWKVNNAELLSEISPTNSNIFRINMASQVYGHLSRVFRCLILDNYFITAGEDSLLIMWNFDGVLLRKIDTHQGGPVWSVCYDNGTDVICSGGNDGGILTFKAHPKIIKETICFPASESPKNIKILKSGNMICLSDEATLYYRTAQWNEVARLTDLQKYSLLEVSTCKRMVGLVGFEGQIYIYCEINGILKLVHIYSLKNKTRIFSFHWIDCKTFLVSQKDGIIHLFFIYEHKIRYVQTFILPPVKDRWPTCACAIKDHILVGDRKGSIHNFRIGNPNVINSLRKSHSYLGVTNLYLDNEIVISLGRDGLLKRYVLLDGYLECIGYNKTKCSWLTAVENNCLLSFSGDSFIISDLRFQRILFETHCGGGHRSWDYLKDSKYITFSFIKQKIIHNIKIGLEDLKPCDIIEGYHVYEINCLKILPVRNTHIVISGGEDTILRLSLMRPNAEIKIIERLKVHLSSIRAINIYPLVNTFEDNKEEYLLFTAGGRAQIICWYLQIEISNLNEIKLSCTEKCNFYEPLTREDAETRIMDLCSANLNSRIFLFAGCSDGCIKIFQMSHDLVLKYQCSILHSHHSITKIITITEEGTELLLASMATDGILKFWSLSDIYDSRESPALYSFKLHQSGITSCSYMLKNDNLLFLSGGDDNCILLTLFNLKKVKNAVVITQVNTFQNNGIHCAQITGAYMTDNYFITSSIDQKIVIHKWTCKGTEVEFQMLQKYNTAIADLQGLEVAFYDDNLNIYIYGNGLECLEVKLK